MRIIISFSTRAAFTVGKISVTFDLFYLDIVGCRKGVGYGLYASEFRTGTRFQRTLAPMDMAIGHSGVSLSLDGHYIVAALITLASQIRS